MGRPKLDTIAIPIDSKLESKKIFDEIEKMTIYLEIK